MHFNRKEFKDAIHLRYGWNINYLPRLCECGNKNSNDHALTSRGGAAIERILPTFLAALSEIFLRRQSNASRLSQSRE